jgi:rhomboid protease GluP
VPTDMSNAPSRPALCIRCKKLIGANVSICPHCGTRQKSASSLVHKVLAEDLVEALIILCVAVYLLQVGLTFLVDRDSLFQPASFFDIGGPSSRVVMLTGLTSRSHLLLGQFWTLVTASFVHLSLLHIGFNMMWLSGLGRTATHFWGTARFLLVFTLTGIGGFLLSNVAWGGPTAGASCSLFGLMGALATFGYRRGGTVGQQIKSSMVRWVVLATLISFGIGGVNHYGHGGGLITGIALGFWLPARENEPTSPVTEWAAIACIVGTAICLGMSLLFWFYASPMVFGSG